MSTLKFKAKVAHASNEEECYMVGFADDAYDITHYILLQKAHSFDEQDIASGMDGEYLEVDGQENSGYKCCKKSRYQQGAFCGGYRFR